MTASVNDLTLTPPEPGDICDKRSCPAKATVSVLLKTGGKLVFCGHHYDSQETLHKVEIKMLDTRVLTEVMG